MLATNLFEVNVGINNLNEIPRISGSKNIVKRFWKEVYVAAKDGEHT